ncbi:MAG: hypothetical protein KZQ64_15310 [gamma proteobacterium symbiont of Bathyaustriella thionipta]|nr:hypothetical protein [gamma proteobacterium symbiont of Bathyaustriella thionipta]MCU7950562.1 hypothetical protein [gamma proteobacterium symbiont of Bathyaustriella thionipta]MCU7954737.1 hypothetical protein [gamma proteobacterium symbiont of Bathyaustriella thionipta]MCU7957074.1 hypothetical protein [gamma proteobacterium symbiont of Bathyaustriella thionipta]MCU7967959.1 hypothetical protein [gamma proteobacterium symbiont of Bathyaustriella thionipta]
MGQKTEYNPDDWDVQDETALEPMQSEIILPDDFYSKTKKTQSATSLEVKTDVKSESEITAFLNGEKIEISRQNTDQLPLSQEEEAFRRQIEDLFELLELEKSSTKAGSVRVYQTDSSPSRPWRFH